MTTRCRFAPSPTGQLHVGGARTALFNFLYARATGGRFVLRIEDTDQVRSSRASEEAIVADLAWLGIGADEGPETGGPGAPYRQSERLGLYQEHLDLLIARGRAYRAWESREELDALRAEAAAAKENFRFRRPSYSDDDLARFEAEGRAPVVRIASPGHDVTFDDGVLGSVTVPAEELDDFVICKADGFPTYHFAVVVDDHHMEVTQVLRAQEHLKNTAKHLVLYQAFGWPPPAHAHAPLIFSMTGGKMSKRDKAKAARAAARAAGMDAAALAERTGLPDDVLRRFLKKKDDDVAIAQAVADAVGEALPEIDVVDFRRAGYLPEALSNFLALLGWSPGDDREVLSMEAIVAAFDLSGVGTAAARFDRDKLRWMNGTWMRELPEERVLDALRAWAAETGHALGGLEPSLQRALVRMYRARANTLSELAEQASMFLERPVAWGPPKAIKKHLLKGDGLARLQAGRDVVASCEAWTAAGIEAALQRAADAAHGGQMGKLAQPIRVAVAGGPVSPAIGETLETLGKDETVERIDRCLAHFAASRT